MSVVVLTTDGTDVAEMFIQAGVARCAKKKKPLPVRFVENHLHGSSHSCYKKLRYNASCRYRMWLAYEVLKDGPLWTCQITMLNALVRFLKGLLLLARYILTQHTYITSIPYILTYIQ